MIPVLATEILSSKELDISTLGLLVSFQLTYLVVEGSAQVQTMY